MKFSAKSGLGKAAATALCAGLCCTFIASAQAQSDRQNGQQQRREGPRDFRDNRWGEARDMRDPRVYEQRAYEQRAYEQRADDQRRALEEQRASAEASRRMGRMTPDERRDLRRQINEVGQQVYSRPPKR